MKKFKLEVGRERVGAVTICILGGTGEDAKDPSVARNVKCLRCPDSDFQEFERALKKLKRGSILYIEM